MAFPSREKFQQSTRSLAKHKSGAYVCANGGNKFARQLCTDFAAADVHDPADHHDLQSGQHREIGDRDRLRADCGADRGDGLDECLGDLRLQFADAAEPRFSRRASSGSSLAIT